ncbi:MAG: 23S rRNA (uracil(1939)-C(5))-methyltransferase RlmD [Verrucomicrobia bacterium]|nr:23S rRNA (uracil(1939)-C(5))-methyltransferase RlmD [Verrucomicrobiota bacterium]
MDNNTTLSITELSPEGYGQSHVLRPDGQGGEKQKIVLVPYTLPGETVEATLYRCKSKSGASFLAKTTSLLTSSSLRIAPKCKHFGSCGGCLFQHMPYESQLAFKEKKVRSLFDEQHITDGASFLPIIAANSPWQYRNKMEFTFSQAKSGQKFLGLFMRDARGRVFDVEECHLVHPWMANTLAACRSWWDSTQLAAYYCGKNQGTLRLLTLRDAATTGDRVVMLTVSGNPDYAMKRHDLDTFVQAMKACATPAEGAFLTIVLKVQQIAKGKPTQFYEMRLHGPEVFRERVTVEGQALEFQVSPSSFFQPNSLQASVLYSKALSMAGLSKEQVLYDLYAGIGVFGMCAASRVKQVLSCEICADSSYDATCNVDRLGLTNVEVCKGDVAQMLAQKGKFPSADVVIVDPPRSGLGSKTIQEIAALGPATILYVSCNPATQAKDIKEFIAFGYRLEAVQPVDQFPQTIHVENIAVLRK